MILMSNSMEVRVIKLCFLALGVLSCSKDNSQRARVELELTRSQSEWLRCGNDLGFTLFKNLYGGKTENCLLSPVSVQVALGMLAAGTEGTTAEEIVKAMGFGADAAETVEYMESLCAQLKRMDEDTKVAMAQSLLVNNTGFATVLPSYIQTVSAFEDFHLFSYDFSREADEAVRAIDGWASDHTSGQIPFLIGTSSALHPTHVAILAEALLFRGKWALEFQKERSSAGLFVTEDGTTSRLSFMNQFNGFDYYEDDRKQALTMDYGNGSFCFTVILPFEGVPLSEITSEMDEKTFQSILEESTHQPVAVTLPIFTQAYDLDLSEILETVGICEIFTRDADFSRLVGGGKGRVYVSSAYHKVFFQIDEVGSTATSTTRIDIKAYTSSSTEEIRLFNADHPFMYIVSERSSSAILFLGTFTGCE